VRVGWLQVALDDLEELRAYIAADDPTAADRVVRQIDAAVARLASFPNAGRGGRVAGTRELAVPRTLFLVIYHVVADEVRVLRVLHGAQRWPPR
jgi:toxin ParE1/3/4